MEKFAKGLPSLNRSKLSKTPQQREDEIQKQLYEDNKWWNYWKFQLHWNKLEWVNPRAITKRNKPFSVSAKSLNKGGRTSQQVKNSKLK